MSPSKSSGDARACQNVDAAELLELTAYAKKLPKTRAVGSANDSRSAEVSHKAFQKVISVLQKKPDWVLDILGELELRLESKASVVDDVVRFDEPVSTLGKLPTQWWAGWLQTLSGYKLNDDMLAKLLVQDSGCVDKLVRFATQLPSGVILPQSLSICKLAARAFDERSRALGSPFSSVWVADHIKSDGAISWGKGGPLCIRETWGQLILSGMVEHSNTYLP